ncbi:MAG: GNAT family N-acetyltransferase, partial [Candidatus Cyclobacteriaceae bacterium M2_1C_046]
MVHGIQNNLASSNKYIVRFARDADEVRAAQKLRFNVFNLELGEGLESAYEQQYDTDKYDEQCYHLLVLKRDSEEVIGTYRMQDYKMAQNRNGFYTADEFNLQSIPDRVLQQGVEVGRACIAKEHRNGRVLFLLWRGLAEYLNQKKA